MKSLLIIAYECAPYHRPGSAIGAQRAYQFSKHLPLFGWRGIVLCCDFKKRWTISSLQIASTIEESFKKKPLNSEDSFIVPLPSLISGGYWDSIWLSSVFVDSELGTFSSKPGFWNFLKRKLSSAIKLFHGDYSQSWQKVALETSVAIIEKIHIDLIMACHGPDASIYVAQTLNQRFGCPWIVDFRDPILLPYPNWIRPLLRRHYKRLFASANFLINVNPAWVKFDHQDFEKESVLITNGFDEEEILIPTIEKHSVLNIGFYGNLSLPGNIELLVSSLKKLSIEDKEINWRLHYYGTLSSVVSSLAKQNSIEDKVLIKIQISRSMVLNLMAKMDILILFSLDSSKVNDPYLSQGYYPGKVFEMLGMNRPILLIPGDGGVLDELVSESGIGKRLSSEIEIIEVIKSYYRELIERGAIICNPNSSFIKNFTRQEQTKLLVRAMEETLS